MLEQQWRGIAAQSDAVLLDGFHALKHAWRFGADVVLAVTSDKPAAIALTAKLAPDLVERASAELIETDLSKLGIPVHPTSIAAWASRPAEPTWGGPRTAPVVLLDNPRHLGNVGAVIRLAAGMNATGVVTTGTLDPWHPNVVRASAGLHFATAVARVSPQALPPGRLYCLDPDGADIREVTFPADAVLAFGSERHGISAQVRGQADELVAVPMRPGVSSFNLATSVAMALFHWMTRSG
ncbi:TrmH family RNA methyltransferase [Catelliglobosispora koreensis]|uniref:TrmH family RNA methyltransferase n=1 Tax=Catelliglobosispora koreensis TaxID=129052 RepID=UPI00036BDC1B|nr:TrmH family RNA methyltransferase [Catelliglobosispora koreensis]